MGVTTMTASVTPAPRPADRSLEVGDLRCGESLPKKTMPVLVFPVDLSANEPLYVSNDAKRIPIFGIMPRKTAPKPYPFNRSNESQSRMSKQHSPCREQVESLAVRCG